MRPKYARRLPAAVVLIGMTVLCLAVGLLWYGTVSPDDPQVTVSEPMTFEEAVGRYADNEGIPYQEALSAFPAPPGAGHYRAVSIPLEVARGYRPRLEVFCRTDGEDDTVAQIDSVQLLRSYAPPWGRPVTMQFSGNIQLWLRENGTIEYVLNGDFFRIGTTDSSVDTQGGAGVDRLVSITATVPAAVADSHCEYVYIHEFVPT